VKRRIYVVDDQAQVADLGVRIARSINPEWEVRGFSDPLEALAAVKAKPPDLILSDQAMPQMPGSQLLDQVRVISPATIRIIMSGHVAWDKLTLLTTAHQHLAIPFDTLRLRETIKRGLAAQERILDKGLLAVTTSLGSIPSLSQAHQAALKELEENAGGTANIAPRIAMDAGLSAKVLQLANSPLFGPGYLITNPLNAVMCLGDKMTCAVVLAQSLFRHHESLAGEIDPRKIWNHCWHTAFTAQRLCRERRLSRITGEEAFLAGLLHESGRFILADNFPEQFRSACQAARATQTALAPRLREAFHDSPAQITAYVLELWGMPATIVAALAQQDAPAPETGEGFTLASALYIADGLASRQTPPDVFAPEDWNIAYLKAIDCWENIPEWEKLSLGTKPNI